MASNFNTTTGLTIGTLQEYIAEIAQRFRDSDIYGETARTNAQSVLGQMIILKADLLQINAALFRDALDQMFPSSATGIPLAKTLEFNGITKNEATYSTVTLQLTANEAGSTVAAGKLFSDGAGAQFATDTAVAIGALDSELVSATAVETGAIEALAGAITTIDTPVLGLASVTNPADANVGRAEESWPRQRARRWIAATTTGGSSTPAIHTALADLDGVTDVNIHWTQPRTLNAVVEGGTDADIAATLFQTVAGGTLYAGPESLYYTDPTTGQSETIRWYRVIEVPVYVTVQVEKLPGYTTASTGDALMKSRILEYFDGDLEIEGELVAGQTVGRNVVGNHIYSAANSVPNCNIRNVFIDVNPSPASTEDITIQFFQRAVTSRAYIMIVEV